MFVFNSPHEAADHHRMTAIANAHEMQNFLTGLSKEDLNTLRMLMLSCADPESGPFIAAQHHGMIIQIQALSHGSCVCGTEHEDAEALLKDVGSPHPEGTGETYSEPGNLIATAEGAMIAQVEQVTGMNAETATSLMGTYRVSLTPDLRLVCDNCGLTYPSLRDRMMKGPDDCHGCHMKSAQG